MATRRTYSEQEREQAAVIRREKVTQLQQKLSDNVATLNNGDAWQKWLSMAARFHRYSFNNVLLITLQKPDATLVAGYRAWQAMGYQVRAGERSIKVLGPVTRRMPVLDPSTGVPLRDSSGDVLCRRQMVGVKPVSVFDVSQVDTPPQLPPQPQLLTGQAPDGLWEALAVMVISEGYRLSRGPCGDANGYTDYSAREVRVRADVDDAQAVKTLAHELGHVLLPPGPGEPHGGACRGLREVEAESVAYVMTQAHGLDTAQYTLSYVAGWAIQATTAQDTIEDVVSQTGARVIEAADRILEQTLASDPEKSLVDQLAVEVGVESPAHPAGTVQPTFERVAANLAPLAEMERMSVLGRHGSTFHYSTP